MSALGAALPAGLSADEALDLAAAAEELGLSSLWVGELRTFDAFGLASAIGRVIPRIRLVIGPLPSITRTPAQLAMGCATVSHLGRRPADLALGASSPAIVQGWHGRPWSDVVGNTATAAREVRAVLDGVGEDFRMRFSSPQSRVFVAAQGPKMRRVAADADGLVLNLVAAHQVEEATAGDTPTAVWLPLCQSHDDPSVAAFLKPYLDAPGYRASLAQLIPDGAVLEDAVGVIARNVCASLDEGVAGRLSAYAAAGADSIVLLPIADSAPARIGLLHHAAQIVPS